MCVVDTIKSTREQLGLNQNQIMDAEEQVGDLYSALKMHFVTMNIFGVNVKEIEKRCNRKLRNRGYVRGNRQKKRALI